MDPLIFAPGSHSPHDWLRTRIHKKRRKGAFFFDIRHHRRLLHKGYIFHCQSHFRGTKMSQTLCCLGLKRGSENSSLKIYVKLSKRHDVWALSLSEIRRMKCDTSSPLFQYEKSFKSYWVLTQRSNAFKGVYCEWRHLGVQNLMVCVTPFRGQYGDVWTRVGSTYVWEWTPGNFTSILMKYWKDKLKLFKTHACMHGKKDFKRKELLGKICFHGHTHFYLWIQLNPTYHLLEYQNRRAQVY